MIAIVTAMPEERAALMRPLTEVRQERLAAVELYCGKVNGQEVCVAEGGMGTAAAAVAAKELAKRKPSLLISAGYCGAVRPGPAVGDLVVCRTLLSLEGGKLQQIAQHGDGQPTAGNLAAELQRHGLRAWQGSFITTRDIVTKSAMAACLATELPHPVLEMESAAVAQVAAMAGIPFIGLRAVSDDAAEELLFSLEEICAANGRVALRRVLWLLARRPWLLPQFLRLAAGSAKAGKSLGQALEVLLATR